MRSMENVAQWLESKVQDLVEPILANDSDSEFFSGMQEAYSSVYMYITGEYLATTELPDQF